jgi:hypothetical protein
MVLLIRITFNSLKRHLPCTFLCTSYRPNGLDNTLDIESIFKTCFIYIYMKQKNYSIRPFWDCRAMDEKTKLSRIMINVNLFGSRQFRITVRVRSTKAEFDKAINANSKKLTDEAYSVRKDLNEYLLKAETILERLDNPTQEMFSRLFKSETDLFQNNKTSIVPFFNYKISRLFGEEKFSTSACYKLSLTSIVYINLYYTKTSCVLDRGRYTRGRNLYIYFHNLCLFLAVWC